MCGRFTQAYTLQQVHDVLSIIRPNSNLQPRYNLAPTMTVDAVIATNGHHELVPMRWGLVPSWWKKSLRHVPATFNARAETVAEKPMFRAAFKRSRCIIPASGFYEWTKGPEGKQPHYITARDGSILAFAGLWEAWTDSETQKSVTTCTIIVTAANAFMSSIHDRMPVILDLQDIDPWLDGHAGTELLRPAPEDTLQEWPVSRRVNAIGKADDASLIEPLWPQTGHDLG